MLSTLVYYMGLWYSVIALVRPMTLILREQFYLVRGLTNICCPHCFHNRSFSFFVTVFNIVLQKSLLYLWDFWSNSLPTKNWNFFPLNKLYSKQVLWQFQPTAGPLDSVVMAFLFCGWLASVWKATVSSWEVNWLIKLNNDDDNNGSSKLLCCNLKLTGVGQLWRAVGDNSK